MPIVLCDTSPLQYLRQIRQLNLLAALYSQVTIPDAVSEELRVGRQQSIDVPDPASIVWLLIAPVDKFLQIPGESKLGLGELGILTLAEKFPGSLAVLDGLARRYAKELGLTFVGTLGVLLEAKRVGLITSVGPLVNNLAERGFRVSPRTLNAVLRLAGEGD